MNSLNIVFTGAHAAEVRTEPVPALKPNQVLLRASRTLISTGTEGIVFGRLFAPETHWDSWVKYPFYPGYSFVGTVEEIGAGVTNVRVGERVAAAVSHREYAVCDAGALVPLPDGVSDEDGAWFHLAWIAQIGVRYAAHTLGDTSVVIGLGIIGQLVCQYLRLQGAREVIAIDTVPRRLELARAHGATQTLLMGAAEAKSAVMDLTGGRGADVVYDATGHPAVFAPALGLARRFGTLLLLGDAGDPSEQRLTTDVIGRGVRIIPAHDNFPPPVSTDHAFWSKPEMARLFLTYLQRGEMRVSDLVSDRFAPRAAPAAYHKIMTDRAAVMGVVFDWTKG